MTTVCQERRAGTASIQPVQTAEPVSLTSASAAPIDRAYEQQAASKGAPQTARTTTTQTQDLNNQLAQLEKEQTDYEQGVLRKAQNLTEGARKNVENTTKTLQEMDNQWFGSRLINRASGSQAAVEELRTGEQKALEGREQHQKELEASLKESRELAAKARGCLTEAARLEAAGKSEEASKVRQQAQGYADAAGEHIGGKQAINKERELAGMKANQQAAEHLNKAANRIDTAYKTGYVVREGMVYGADGIAYAVGGSAASASVNMALRSATNGAEEIANVATGQKTKEQALKDFGGKTADAAVESGAILAGGALGGKVAGAAGKAGLGAAAQAAAKIGGSAAVGAAVEAGQVAYDMGKAKLEFDSKFGTLQGAERDRAWEQFKAERLLSGSQIGKRIGAAAAGNAITMGLGHAVARAAGSQAATAAGKVGAAVAQHTADAAGNVAQQVMATGDISAQGLAAAAIAAGLGHQAGRASPARAGPAHSPQHHTASPAAHPAADGPEVHAKQNQNQKTEPNTEHSPPKPAASPGVAPERKPFNGMTQREIMEGTPPPVPIPPNAAIGEPYTAKSGADRLEVNYTLSKDQINLGGAGPLKSQSPQVNIQWYFHNYGPNDPRPDNWRVNVTVGSGKNADHFVAIRRPGSEGQPLGMKDLELLQRGPSNPEVVDQAISALKAGTATPEQIEMLHTTWKGMEQVDKFKEELLARGRITPEQAAHANDITKRGHFVPGSYEVLAGTGAKEAA